jgi:cobalt-zinc-cadmium efflux system membrane fusion protein
VAHIVPQVSGVARKIYKRLGDRVQTGELMAVLESRELADAKSAYFVAQERLALAQAILVREEKLWKKKISAERDYLKAKRDLAETKIELNTAEKKLHTLGILEKALRQLSKESPMEFSRYEIRSPFVGTVIEKHITIGEMLMTNSKAFAVADLSNVWVNMNVYQKDIPFVAIGQQARISTAHGILKHEGTISYISPLVGERTRTAIARVVLPNLDGRWKPGMFINAKVIIEEVPAKIMIPKSAIQTVEDKPTIFVLDAESGGFAPRHVTIGKSDDKSVEIVSSLKVGEKYVSRGAFILKAEMGKGELDSGHHH